MSRTWTTCWKSLDSTDLISKTHLYHLWKTLPKTEKDQKPNFKFPLTLCKARSEIIITIGFHLRWEGQLLTCLRQYPLFSRKKFNITSRIISPKKIILSKVLKWEHRGFLRLIIPSQNIKIPKYSHSKEMTSTFFKIWNLIKELGQRSTIHFIGKFKIKSVQTLTRKNFKTQQTF